MERLAIITGLKGPRGQGTNLSFSCVPRIFVYKQLLDMRVGVALEACVRFPRVAAEKKFMYVSKACSTWKNRTISMSCLQRPMSWTKRMLLLNTLDLFCIQVGKCIWQDSDVAIHVYIRI